MDAARVDVEDRMQIVGSETDACIVDDPVKRRAAAGFLDLLSCRFEKTRKSLTSQLRQQQAVDHGLQRFARSVQLTLAGAGSGRGTD